MVRTVVPEGSPPPVCWANSHHEKVRGRTAVPRSGPPQATVAEAVTRVESWPMTGANQCWTGSLPLTVTRVGLDASTGGAAVAPSLLAVTIAAAVAAMFPQAPRAQSAATASAAASAATW